MFHRKLSDCRASARSKATPRRVMTAPPTQARARVRWRRRCAVTMDWFCRGYTCSKRRRWRALDLACTRCHAAHTTNSPGADGAAARATRGPVRLFLATHAALILEKHDNSAAFVSNHLFYSRRVRNTLKGHNAASEHANSAGRPAGSEEPSNNGQCAQKQPTCRIARCRIAQFAAAAPALLGPEGAHEILDSFVAAPVKIMVAARLVEIRPCRYEALQTLIVNGVARRRRYVCWLAQVLLAVVALQRSSIRYAQHAHEYQEKKHGCAVQEK